MNKRTSKSTRRGFVAFVCGLFAGPCGRGEWQRIEAEAIAQAKQRRRRGARGYTTAEVVAYIESFERRRRQDA
jgi:hypothetical protein